MSGKLRVNGETIDPRKMYAGDHVLELIRVSFNNGIMHANLEHGQAIKAEYNRGYKAGYEIGYRAASDNLNGLRSLLRKILMEEAL